MSDLYMIATASSSSGLGLAGPQTGAEIGGEARIGHAVEMWWRASWATAPKLDAGGKGDATSAALEIAIPMARRWLIGAGYEHVRMETPDYTKAGGFAFLTLTRRGNRYSTALSAGLPDSTENEVQRLSLEYEARHGRGLLRLALEWSRFVDSSGERDGLRILLGVGLSLRGGR